MKPQLPQPMPGDPEQLDDEEEELLKRKVRALAFSKAFEASA